MNEIETFCEYIEMHPRAVRRFRDAVATRDAEAAARIVANTTGSLLRQLNYATQVVAYGPSTASQYKHHSRVTRGYSPEERDRLHRAHTAGQAVVHSLTQR